MKVSDVGLEGDLYVATYLQYFILDFCRSVF